MWIFITDKTNGSRWVNLTQLLAIEFDDEQKPTSAKIFWAQTHLVTQETSEIEALRRWVTQNKF